MNKITSPKCVCVLTAVLLTGGAFAAGDSLDGMGNVCLKGYLGERLDAMIANHVAAQDVDYITAPFMEKTERRGWWQTEFWGKWMHSAVPYCKLEHRVGVGERELESGVGERLKSKIERGIERMLASQEKSGYIGNYPDELRCGEGWDVWGMKYTIMGLLHYYDFVRARELVGEKSGSWRKDVGEGGEKSGSWRKDVGEGGEKSSREDVKHHSQTPTPHANSTLEACKKLCDYVIAEIGPGGKRGRELWQTGNWSGYASSSILEPVVWLYRRCGEKKYLDFAAYIVKGMSEPESGPRLIDLALKGVSVADRNGYGNKAESHGGYVMKHNRWKSYEMMSCYQGMLDFYEVLSETPRLASAVSCPVPPSDLFRAAVMTAEDIVKEEINLAGGCASSEAWFHGARKQHLPYLRLQETCVTTTWMRFCEKLLDMTDDPKWADQLERTFYNAYLAAMKADGAEFAGYTPLSGTRYHGQHHCYMHTDCCTANGPRGFLCFLKKLFSVRGGAVTFNFYSSALVKGELPGGRKVAFDMYSLYPRTNAARIVSHTEGAGDVPLRLRIPGWSAKTEVKVNGKVLSGVKPGSYFTISRDWKFGDIVEIKFDMPVVAHVLDHNVAFTRGPILLARDSRFADGDHMEPFRQGIKEGQAMPMFSAVRTPSDDLWMAFSATLPIGSHHANPEASNPSTVFFCDYASAGNTWHRDNHYRTWFPIEYGPQE